MTTDPRTLAGNLVAAAGRVSAVLADFLDLVARFDAIGGFRADACSSTADWLATRCEINPMTAREYVRVARALHNLPEFRREFHAGTLSYSKVRALTRVATKDDQADLLRVARGATAAELESHVAAIRRGRAATDPTFARRHRSLRGWIDAEGMGVIHALLPPDDQATVWSALREWRRQSGVSAETEAPGLDEPAPHEKGYADALVGIARDWLHGSRGSRSAVYLGLVHVDSRTGSIHSSDGPQISVPAAERILCDAALARVRHQSAVKLELGRTERVVSPALRRALEIRDGGCAWPGCRNKQYVQAHHIRHWSRGGATRLENLALLCDRHHRSVHDDDWRLARGPGGEIVVHPPGDAARRTPGPAPNGGVRMTA